MMSRDPIACSPDDSFESCEQLMREKQIRRLPVTDAQGRCVGMVAQADIFLHEIPEKLVHMLAGLSVPRTFGIVGSRVRGLRLS